MSRFELSLVCFAISQVFLAGVALSQAPVVDSVSPAQNELNVAASADISVRFSEAMDSITIDSSTFLVCGEFSGPCQGSISYDAGSRIATFDPYHEFSAGEQVAVVLTSGVESVTSQSLDDFLWSFTVATTAGSGVCSSVIQSCHKKISYSLAATDVDGDHDHDLVYPIYNGATLYVVVNNGDETFQSVVYPAPDSLNSIAVGDINEDNAVDVVTSTFSNSQIVTFFNNGDGTFAPYVADTVPNAPRQITLADFDADGHLDLLAVYPSIDRVAIHFGVGDGTFAGMQSFAVNAPYAVVAADLDNDGCLDIAVTSAERDTLEVILTGEIDPRSIAQRTSYPVGNMPMAVISADLNGDRLLDLAVADTGSGDFCVLLNDSNDPGNFLEPSFYAMPGAISLDAADFDGDGDIDIIAAYSRACGSVRLFMNDGNGVFADAVGFGSGCYQTGVVAADLDGDSDLDLALSLSAVYNLRFAIALLINDKLMSVKPTNLVAVAIEGDPYPIADRHIAVTANVPDVEFSAVEDVDWLTIAPSSGVVPGDITVHVITDGLVAGEYTGSIEISSETDNSPLIATVDLTVYPPGTAQGDHIRTCVDSLAAGTVGAEIPFVIQRLCPYPERIMGISNGFTLHATGDATWEFVEYVPDWTVYYWWNLGGMLFTNGFNDVSPDTFLVGGAAMPPGGMPVTPEHYMMSLVLDIGPGEGEILIDSAFVFSAGTWRWSGLVCGKGGAADRPLFVAKDSSDLVHPISIRIYAVCGDVDRSVQTDIDDAVFLLTHIFLGGPAPNPESAGDVDCSGVTDIDDVVYLMFYIFAGGPCVPCD